MLSFKFILGCRGPQTSEKSAFERLIGEFFIHDMYMRTCYQFWLLGGL